MDRNNQSEGATSNSNHDADCSRVAVRPALPIHFRSVYRIRLRTGDVVGPFVQTSVSVSSSLGDIRMLGTINSSPELQNDIRMTDFRWA